MKKLLIGLLLVLMLIPMSAWALGPVPYEIWTEIVYYQNMAEATGGNPMGHGQVLIDGCKTIIAEGDAGALLYGDEQINGTALVARTEDQDATNYVPKGATMLNGRLYGQDASTNIRHCKPWYVKDAPVADRWNSPGFDTGRGSLYSSHDTYGLLTDGTYLYGSANFNLAGESEDGGSEDNCITKIYKWTVDPNTYDVTGVAEGWPVTIYSESDPHSYLISMGYYNGKLYAAEGYNGRNIFEIDCATGAYQEILSGDNLIPTELATNYHMGQIARLGDTIVLANWTGHLTTWRLVSGVWTLTACNFISRPYIPVQFFLGVSLMPGPDGNAKYAWTSSGSWVQFYDLYPDWSLRDLGEARKMKNGYPNGVQNAVVTKVGTGEYWIEATDRSSACRVAGDIAPDTVGKLVSMTGSMDTNTAGEKFFTPNAAPTVGAAADPVIEPVYVSGKDLVGAGGTGLATDGMLVKITGKVNQFVEQIDETTFIVHVYVDDGSALATDREGNTGVEVVWVDWSQAIGFEFLMGSARAEVTGVLRLVKAANGNIVRKIEPLANTDIVFSAL